MDFATYFIIASIWCLGLILTLFNPGRLLFFYLAKAFFVQLCWLCLALGLIFFIFGKYLSGLIALLPIALFFAEFIRRLPVKRQAKDQKNANNLSVFSGNIKRNNKLTEEVSRKLVEYEPDVVFLIEYDTNKHTAYHDKLSAKYEYSDFKPEIHPYANAIYSKYPIKDVVLESVGGGILLSAKLILNSFQILLITVHPFPPTSLRRIQDQDKMFRRINEVLKKSKMPAIVAGDFNAVPWYRNLSAMAKQSNLAYANSAWLPTFPSWLPIFRIPIDHILYTDDFEILNTRRIRLPGSDHFGILSQLKY